MSLHTQDITARLTRYLTNRKTPPKRLQDNPSAQQDEIVALVGAIERRAPRDAQKLADWWALFEVKLDESTGHTWPIVKEIAAAADGVRGGPAMVDLSGNSSLDHATIIAKRMRERGQYPETALYGILACELIAKGLVDEDTMLRCRSEAFFRREDAYGRDAALKWEADRKAAHEEAKVVWRDKAERRARRLNIPDLTSKPQGEAA